MTPQSPHQLTLSVSLPDTASFENFHAASNRELISVLRHIAGAQENGPRLVHLFGASGSGKTHLLYAAMRQAREHGMAAAYVAAGNLDVNASLLTHIDARGLVCVDDVDAVAAQPEGERALLQLYERVLAEGGHLLIAAAKAVRHLGIRLPDLASRLLSGAAYRVTPLNDLQKREVLSARAMSRGFVLSDEVLEYVLRRYPRDTHALFALLERLDGATLRAQRRVTIPFLQELEEH